MLFVLAGLQGIAPELHEAAKLDGAGACTRFLRITLPLLKPTLAFILVIAMINVVTQIDHVIVLTGGARRIRPTSSQLHLPGGASARRYRTRRRRDHRLGRGLLSLSVASLKTLERGMHYES